MTTNAQLSLDKMNKQQKQQKLLEILQDAVYSNASELQIDCRLLVPWEDFTHPYIKLFHSRRWTMQIVIKGFALSRALKVIFGFLITAIAGYVVGSGFVAKLDKALNHQGHSVVLFNWFEQWLVLQLVGFVSWLYAGTDQIAIIIKGMLVGFSLSVLLLSSACILGYLWGKIYVDIGCFGLSIKGVYHVDPTGQWCTPWSEFFAVRWTARTVCQYGKTVRWHHRMCPIRLLLPEGGSIRLWGCKADRDWLTKVMELLIALHNLNPSCKLSVHCVDPNKKCCRPDLTCAD